MYDGQPEAGLNVQAPAIEVEIEAVEAGKRRVNAVEADDGVVLIFHPEAALEAAACRISGAE